VLVADPGRAFVPKDRLTPVMAYEVPVLAAIEDVAVKTVTVYRLAGRPGYAPGSLHLARTRAGRMG
jgi:hypothetical protein